MIRVLHCVGTFLKRSENWIYPQIFGAPGVDGGVFCTHLSNLDEFPCDRKKLFIWPPPWDRTFGIPRCINVAARRLGIETAYCPRRVRSWKPRLIHAHFGTQGFERLTLSKQLNVPLITSFYGADAWEMPEVEPAWRHRFAELFATGQMFLVEGPAMKERLIHLGCLPEKIRVHTIGVDLSDLPFKERNFSNGLKIVMVGRFVEKKGLADGLRACALARARGVNLTITIIGDAAADHQPGQVIKRELQAIAESDGLSGRVYFAGFRTLREVRELLQNHNVFLCPSHRATNGDAEGGSPVVLTEAMATGLLCVGTEHCDIPEVIDDQRTGFLASERDISGLADILCKLNSEEAKLADVTRQGRMHIEKIFCLHNQVERLAEIYGEIATQRKLESC